MICGPRLARTEPNPAQASLHSPDLRWSADDCWNTQNSLQTWQAELS